MWEIRQLDEKGKLLVVEPTHGYPPSDSIVQDLKFAPAKPIRGRFVDDLGQPIADVKVYVTNCDYLGATGTRRDKPYREFRDAVGQAAAQMPDQVRATSDAEGRFELASIPAGIVCRLAMSHPTYGKSALLHGQRR